VEMDAEWWVKCGMRNIAIAAERGAGASVIQVCTLQIPANGKRVKAYVPQ